MNADSDSPWVSLSSEARALVERALEFGRRERIDLFLVGGAVRDLLTGVEVRDLDFVWEGEDDPKMVAQAFGEAFATEVSYHPEFLTASLTGPGGLRMDLGRARSETYAAPAALPSVKPAELRQDLARRDFSINAMAVPLARPEELVDPCHGAADLGSGWLRTLHELSFRDDPTRILRACELAIRRGYEFEPGTREQVETALGAGYLTLPSGTRIRHELARLFAAPHLAAASARRLQALGVDRALHRHFRIDAEGLGRLGRLADWSRPREESESGGETPFWIIAMTALLWHRPRSVRRAVADWLCLGRGERAWLDSGPERMSRLLGPTTIELPPEAMARLYAQLSRMEIRTIELLAEGGACGRLSAVRKLSRIQLEIRGSHLLAAGVPFGPRIGAALEATLAARRRGEIEASGELDFALAWLSGSSREGLEDDRS